MDKQLMAKAFNEWQRRYIQNPLAFRNEFDVLREFYLAASEGREPDHGELSAAYFEKLCEELAAA